MSNNNQLTQAAYVSLATFRNSGAMVPTPVWCAEDQGNFYIFSAGNAGKVKRLRNSNRAQLACCDLRGKLLGPWHNASAELVTDATELNHAHALLRKKYGWQMRLLDVGAKLSGKYDRRAYIRVRLEQS